MIAPSEDKKRRRAFLLSPQIKRGLQTRKPKRTAVDKNSESGASRSSSSSPDDKRACNECLKGGGKDAKLHFYINIYRVCNIFNLFISFKAQLINVRVAKVFIIRHAIQTMSTWTLNH